MLRHLTYLIDTNVIVDHFRKTRFIDQHIIYQTGITYFTLTELIYGAYRSTNRERNLNLIEEFIQDFDLHFLPLTKEVVFTFAKLKVDLEKEGGRLEDFDLFIAATAITNDLILVTNNKRHFQRIKGLKIYGS